MNRELKNLLLFLIIAAALLLPAFVLAQGLVPCGTSGTPACTLCDLFKLAKNVFDFIMQIAFAIAALMIVWAGVLMLIPGNITMGDKAIPRYQKGKRVLFKALAGLVIIFVAWLVIDSVIKILAGQTLAGGDIGVIGGYGPWNSLKCQ